MKSLKQIVRKRKSVIKRMDALTGQLHSNPDNRAAWMKLLTELVAINWVLGKDIPKITE